MIPGPRIPSPRRYDPRLPWGGVRGSPCGDPDLPHRITVSFADLADCSECPICGLCLIHDECHTGWDFLVWLAQFASPGEPACGEKGVIAARPGFSCELPLRHDGDFHKDKRGNGWGISPAASRL